LCRYRRFLHCTPVIKVDLDRTWGGIQLNQYVIVKHA